MDKKLPSFYAKQFNMNSGKLEDTNVLGYIDIDKLQKERRNGHFKTKDDVKKYLKNEFMYHFWSRSEYEMLVSPLVSCPKEEQVYKIDIWQQLEPNLDNITDLVISAMNWNIK